MGPYVRLNGRLYSRNSARFLLMGIDPITSIDTVDWDDERAIELVQPLNQGGFPLGKSEGDYTCNASMGVYADYASRLEDMLSLLDPIAAAAGNLSRINFFIVLQFKEDVRLRTITLLNCNIKGMGSAIAQGSAATVEKYTLQPTHILRNGKALGNLIPTL